MYHESYITSRQTILTKVTVNKLLGRWFDIMPAPIVDVRTNSLLDLRLGDFFQARKYFYGGLLTRHFELLRFPFFIDG